VFPRPKRLPVVRKSIAKVPNHTCQSARRNLPSAASQQVVVQEYIEKEFQLGRVMGPFPLGSVPGIQISLVGVTFKGHTPGRWKVTVEG